MRYTHHQMRRLLAILLLLTFGFPAVAPLLASAQDTPGSLPACCRRSGAHHCLMGAESRSKLPAIGARCPSFPQQSATAPHLTLAALAVTQPGLKLPITTLAAPHRAETQRRISRERSRHKRGPPAALLAA